MLQNEYLLAKFGFDTVENEPCKVCPLSAHGSPRYTSGANEVASSKASKFTIIPDASTWKLSPNAKYFHYCDNETVNGVEFPTLPQVRQTAQHLVAID